MEYKLKGPFWDGFRNGSKYVVWLSLPFAFFALAMANNIFSILAGLLSLGFAVFANVITYKRPNNGRNCTP